ncbi:MAG: AAA family ATPase [Planctomycetes bacterium]|nr:AAA family ATPase [Planctomycetota bacterium]
MYHSHWGLDEAPFRTELDPRYFYQSPTHEEALARLHFLVDYGRRLGLLMGEPGSGKSFLLEMFAGELAERGLPVARVNLMGVGPREMLWLVAGELGLNPSCELPIPSLWRLVTDRLKEYRYQKMDVALLLDDADRASEEVLVQVARLAQSDRSPDAQLTIVVSGCPGRIGRLGESLLEQTELRIDVASWEPRDTEGFVQASLERAGGRSALFADPAIERLHELGEGIPRRVNQLADLALLAGAGRELEEIDVETVESVFRELGVIEV